jgi:signal transduction histidine kinase
MLIRIFLTILLFSFSPDLVNAQSQQLPELLEKWEKYKNSDRDTRDTNRVNLLNAIAESYTQTVPDSALLFAEMALKDADENSYPKGKVRALSTILKTQYVKGAYDLSLVTCFRSLAISNEIQDKVGQANAINGIGLIYLTQNKVAPALQEFKKAAVLNESLKGYSRLSANYFNISLGYFQLNKLDSAILPLMKSIALSTKINDQSMIAMARNRLGEIYFKMGNVEKAVSYFVSVTGNKAYQNEWENSFAHSGLANCYYRTGAFEKAVNHGLEGLRLAKKVNAKWDIERSLKIVHESYAAVKDYERAYRYFLQDKLYSDSLFSESKENEMNALHLKQQQIENRELIKRNQIDQQQIDINRMVILIVGIIALSLIVIIALIYRNILQKGKLNLILQKKSDDISYQKTLIETQNVELSHLNETKDQLFSIIGHDLRGPFASILNTLQLMKSGELTMDETRFILDKFFEKVTVTAAMLDNLLLWANSQQGGITAKFSSVDLPVIIDQLLELLHLLAAEKKITIQHSAKKDALIWADPDHIKVIFQNIIGNAVKFTRPDGHIAIYYEITASLVVVHIKDNGVGIPGPKLEQLFRLAGKDISSYGTQNEKGIGIGLMLVKRFTDKNNAALQVVSEEDSGTDFIFSFKRS